MGHTPGPWEVAPHSDSAEVVEVVSEYSELPGGRKVANWIAEFDAGIDGEEGQALIDALDRNFANARLCAAAPELLDALKCLRNEALAALGIGVSDSIGHTNAKCLGDRCQQAFAAIAKAEGR